MEPLVTDGEPKFWVLAFARHSPIRWVGWLAMGRHKHVRACAPLPMLGAWVFYDVHLTGTTIRVAATGGEAERLWSIFTTDADLVVMPVRRGVMPWWSRWGFFCVPAIKHLIGLRSGALRPSRFFRDCLAAGGQLQHGLVQQHPASGLRSAAA